MTTPTDQPARDAIATSLDETMFVEAGAGSGKTKSLVDRYVALVVDAHVPADAVAAITFTEKAAGELADRVRGQLTKRAPQALADLDRAAICTLHAFAQRILTAFPIEAGLPPRITVLDEIASQIAFEARWERFVDRIIEDPELERPLRLLLAAGASLDELREVAVKLGQSWDLVAERTGRSHASTDLDLSALAVAVRELAEVAVCVPADDGLGIRCRAIADWADRISRAPDDDARVELLGLQRQYKAGTAGRADACGGKERKAAVLAAIAEVGRVAQLTRDRVQHACLDRIVEELAAFTVASARERQADGELEFHDLLVLARRVLRDPTHGVAVRAALRDRYQRLLLDEFQDTDPIQVELAVLVASSDPDAARKHWWDVAPDPGRLFFVGDPKQSIYRFRRADIRVFLRARDHVGGRVERLTTNFRTTKPILDWVNRVFGTVMQQDGEMQPAYVALDHDRQPDRSSSAPHVAFVGVEAHEGKVYADDLRHWEAEDVARAVREAYADGWTVWDDEAKAWRPTTWRDVAILLPARTSLRHLERSLERYGVPYRAETSSLVYGTREVRDLLMIARAVEDPTDGLAVVAALRTPAFACGDDDLLTWKVEHGNGWDHQRAFRDGTPEHHPVARGLTWLRDLHRERHWLSPSQVLDRIVGDRRLLELAYVHPRPRDLWRRVRFVVDQCRAWEEAGGSTLRDYLRWVKRQSAEGSRVVETVLPETDDEAVRILTVHGAKGLEFPIAVLSGLTTKLGRRRNGVQVLFADASDRVEVKLKGDLATEEFDLAHAIEEQFDEHERLRLLYVAATRARDHLIVSVHRKDDDAGVTAAGLFHASGWDPDLVHALAYLDDDEPAEHDTVPAFALEPVAVPPFDAWHAELTAARAKASRPTAMSATRLAELAEAERLAGLQKEPRDIDLPPWQKGRYGSAVGRAVHGVMQTIDLDSGAGLDDLVRKQAAAEGVEGHEATIKRLCENALASDVVKRAAARPNWREVYVGVPHEEYGVLEGYIDLLYRDDDGLVVVDFKTDAWSTEADLDEKVERYSVQLRAYADAVSAVMSEPVVRSLLLFVAGEGCTRTVD